MDGDPGPVYTTQSVTLDGNNLASITFNSDIPTGINIAASASVTLRNLTINGMNSGLLGIFAGNGGIVIVDNCKIVNFNQAGIQFEGAGNLTVKNSQIEAFNGTRVYGIQIDSNAAENVVIRNTVIDASPFANNNYGMYVTTGSGPVMASLQNVTIMDAGEFAIAITSGVTEITGSVLTQNNQAVIASFGATVSVDNSMITANMIGVCSSRSSKIRLDNNDIYDNPTAIANCGGIVKSSTTNKTSGTIAIPAADVSESVTF